jgi:hypothetical protein
VGRVAEVHQMIPLILLNWRITGSLIGVLIVGGRRNPLESRYNMGCAEARTELATEKAERCRGNSDGSQQAALGQSEAEPQDRAGAWPRNYERHKMNTPNFKSSMLIALVILTGCAATSKPPSIVDAPQIQPPPDVLMQAEDLSESYSDIVRRLFQNWQSKLTDWRRKL